MVDIFSITKREQHPDLVGLDVRANIPYVIERRGGVERMLDPVSMLFDERIVYLGTGINDQVANYIVMQLLILEAKDPGKPITLYINSPGGSVYAGMGIYDTMNAIKSPVSTIAVGLAASMGAFLLAAGQPGLRFALPHAKIMIHQPLGGAQGQATDIEIQAREILAVKRMLTEILAHRSNLTYEQMKAECERDNYLTAQKAVEFGIVDKVLPILPAKAEFATYSGYINPVDPEKLCCD